ncbi:MAG: hypothetical protein JEZ07_04820 [Phycisphaerae bacterium]|nr:hypothetical protein [Phycisphaerae bacterium]
MDKKQMKIWGFVCIFLCIFSIFVAFERYQTINRDQKPIRAMAKDMFDNAYKKVNSEYLETLDETMFGPKMPIASKYAIFFTLVFGVTGVTLVLKSNNVSQDVKDQC